MTQWKKIFLGALLSFMCIFTSVGYASLSETLWIEGDVELSPPNAIFIAGISNVQTNGVTITQTPLNIDFPSTKFLTNLSFTERNSSITFDVLIQNGTSVPQYFDVLKSYSSLEGYEDESFSYGNISESVSPSQGEEIAAGASKTFTVTLSYTGSTVPVTRNMLYEFVFSLNSDDLTEAVSQEVTDKFENILNNKLDEITYEYNGTEKTIAPNQTLSALENQMKNNTSESGHYIGNVDDAPGADKALLSALFEGTLSYEINGEEVPITIMIKEVEIYSGNSTSEMVLYITADDLSEFSFWGSATAPVYVAVYSFENNAWTRIGDIYAGKANICSYTGWMGTGSFNTDTWISTEVYYGIRTGSSIATIMSGYHSQNTQ